MKRLIAILLSLAICACCFGAAAGDTPAADNLPAAGLCFTYPQAFTEAKGTIGTDGAFVLSEDIFYAYWYYSAAGEEEYRNLMEENFEALLERTVTLFYVFAIGNGRDFSAVTELVPAAGFTAEEAVPIGQVDSWTFYLYMTQNPGFAASLEPKYGDEYTALSEMTDGIAAGFSCTVPFNEYAGMDNRVIRFEVKDLEGNPLSSEDLFAQNEITMVNLWATWCGPCIDELQELQAIHTRFREKDCGVVGLLIDDDAEAAKKLISENGVSYPVVIAPELMDSIFPFDAVPTSFFVDRDGAYLGIRIVGARPEMYETALDTLMETAGQGN